MTADIKLSEQLKMDHESGDFGNALKGYSERAAMLETLGNKVAQLERKVEDAYTLGKRDVIKDSYMESSRLADLNREVFERETYARSKAEQTVIEQAAALRLAKAALDVAFEYDGDVFGVHHNDATDALITINEVLNDH